MPNEAKTSILGTIIRYLIAFLILFFIYATYQYVELRSNIEAATEELLIDNGFTGFKSDGINLPISAVLTGNSPAKVFLKKNNGNIKLIEVQITSKNIALLAVLTGGEYWVEISGEELIKLQQ